MAGWGDDWGSDWGNDYYASLITSQYKGSVNFMATVDMLLQKMSDVEAVLGVMDREFDIDHAVGDQLDIIGEIIGVSRTVEFQPSGGISPILNNETYRTLLKAQIIQNSWDGLLPSLYDAWKTVFPGGKIVVNDVQNMSAVITVQGTFSSIIVDLINNGYIVPRPQGVLYTYGYGDLPYFGYDQSDAFVGGYDAGHLI